MPGIGRGEMTANDGDAKVAKISDEKKLGRSGYTGTRGAADKSEGLYGVVRCLVEGAGASHEQPGGPAVAF